MFMEDLGVKGVELASDAVEQVGPSGFELTIQQTLSFRPVGQPGEAVVLLTKRSNPESVPAILSWCLAINSCMGRSPPYRSLSLATYK